MDIKSNNNVISSVLKKKPLEQLKIGFKANNCYV